MQADFHSNASVWFCGTTVALVSEEATLTYVAVKQYLAYEIGHMLGTHTFTGTIMHCGVSECDGQQVTWYASAATHSISEMTNSNLLLFRPFLNTGVMTERTGTEAGSVLHWGGMLLLIRGVQVPTGS